MQEFLEKLLRLFMEHRTGGEKAHPNATDRISGFMPSDLYTGSRQRFRHRTYKKSVDIMSLVPGYYQVIDMKNGPIQNTGWVCNVDITYSYDGRKTIYVYDNIANKIYFTEVTSANIFYWQIVCTKKLVFSSSVIEDHQIGKTINLNLNSGETLAHYDRIELLLKTKDDTLARVCVGDCWRGSANFINFNNTDPEIIDMGELSYICDRDKGTLKITNNMHVWYKQGEKYYKTADNDIYIAAITLIK